MFSLIIIVLCVISLEQSLDQCLKSGSVGSAIFPGSGFKGQNINQKLQTLKTKKNDKTEWFTKFSVQLTK